LAEGTISQVESGRVEVTVSDDSLGYNAQQNRDGEKSACLMEVETGNMYEKEISSFANAILNDTEPEITAEDGIFVQKIVENAYLSSEKQQFVNM